MPERFFISESKTGKVFTTTDKTKLLNSDLKENEVTNPAPELFSEELKMLNNVKFTLCTNTDIIQTVPAFVQALDTFEGYLGGITRMYKDIKTRLIQFTCRLASAINTYGVMSENDELIVESSVSEDDLETQSDEILLNKSNKILEHARMYLQAPNPFGIYQEIFLECETVMDNFGYAIGRPQSPLGEKNSWKKEHDRLFINAHEFLRTTLDRLVESLSVKYPCFYREYNLSRIVKKSASKDIQVQTDNKKAGEEINGIPY